MNMKKTTLFIPIAALALSASTAAAFNEDILERAGLSSSQIEAFSEARELKKAGERDAARDVLVEAGIDEETLREIRTALKEERREARSAIKEAIDAEDYNAFTAAVAGLPFSEKITSESDFEKLVQAHALKAAGDREAAAEIYAELGIEKKKFGHGKHRGNRDITAAPFWSELSSTEQEDIQTAIENRDRESVREILEGAGIERG